MILNLFAIFDPCTSEIFRLNWISVLLIFFFVPINYYFIPSLYQLCLLEIFIKMYYELNVFLKCKFSRIIFRVLLCYVLVFNFIGLFPYVFTITRHLVFTLSFSLSFWLAFILYGWVNFKDYILAHLVPLGTPAVLIPFIVLIERVRLLIRPITLSVRLAANIIAGHLLLCLVGESGLRFIIIILFLVFIVQLCLYTLEAGVAFIQAYVFSILSSLYSRDVEFKLLSSFQEDNMLNVYLM